MNVPSRAQGETPIMYKGVPAFQIGDNKDGTVAIRTQNGVHKWRVPASDISPREAKRPYTGTFANPERRSKYAATEYLPHLG